METPGYGLSLLGLLGVCTLEDVLEEIVGEIEDEHDKPTPAGGD